MSAMPSGTVTFLFSDIEGSTRLWEEHPEAMRTALARHDAVMRAAIVRHAGYIFKTMGDSFYAAFPIAPDALEAAIAAQQALMREIWPEPVVLKVRMALHTGAAEMRDNDYFGQPLNRLARLLAAGHGGQILLTEVTHELCSDALPPAVTLTSLGAHQLRDLQRLETIFQLLHPALPSEFPPLRTLRNPANPNNLPQQMTSFIGRAKEIADLATLLTRSRMLTLVGAGGCGKTRLALQFAADRLEQFPDGVYLVELASLADPQLVSQTAALALEIQEQPGQRLQQTLIERLNSKRLLLLLDNCEHLITASAHFASALLRACPQLTVLATSREALDIEGEFTYRVPSLSLPTPGQPHTLESLGRYESVQLFIERAQRVRSDFAVADANATALAQVCSRLDGIPLAIELAAARVRTLSVEELNARLDNCFRLLTGGNRAALPRQQTLRALIDWSYDLLTAPEKRLLARLSVFAGGWTLEAAESVGAGPFSPSYTEDNPGSQNPESHNPESHNEGDRDGEGIEEWEVLDLLTGLVDKSLVIADVQAGAIRYQLLETVRQYASEKLRENGDAAATRTRHSHWYRAIIAQAEPQFNGPEQALWFDRLESEHDNLRAASTWLETTAPQIGLEDAVRLWRFWEVRGYAQEGRARLNTLLEFCKTDSPDSLHAWAHLSVGGLAASIGDYPDALYHYEQSQQIAESVGNPFCVAMAKQQRALAAQETGDTAAASVLLEDAIALYQQLDRHDLVANNQSNLAVLAMDQNDFPRAEALLIKALHLQRKRGDLRSIAITLNNLGGVALDQDDFEKARACQAESLQITCEIGAKRSSAYALQAFADITVRQAQWERAVYYWGAAHQLRETNACPLPPAERTEFEQQLAKVKAVLSAEQFAASWNAGRAAPLSQTLEKALAGD